MPYFRDILLFCFLSTYSTLYSASVDFESKFSCNNSWHPELDPQCALESKGSMNAPVITSESNSMRSDQDQTRTQERIIRPRVKITNNQDQCGTKTKLKNRHSGFLTTGNIHPRAAPSPEVITASVDAYQKEIRAWKYFKNTMQDRLGMKDQSQANKENVIKEVSLNTATTKNHIAYAKHFRAATNSIAHRLDREKRHDEARVYKQAAKDNLHEMGRYYGFLKAVQAKHDRDYHLQWDYHHPLKELAAKTKWLKERTQNYKLWEKGRGPSMRKSELEYGDPRAWAPRSKRLLLGAHAFKYAEWGKENTERIQLRQETIRKSMQRLRASGHNDEAERLRFALKEHNRAAGQRSGYLFALDKEIERVADRFEAQEFEEQMGRWLRRVERQKKGD